MPGGIYTEENGVYQIDCTNAVWSTDQIHTDYQATHHNILSDVDFVIEVEDFIYLVEYKNANIPNADNPEGFKPLTDKHWNKIARKYYDSLHYLNVHSKHKPIKYIYVVEEYPMVGRTERLLLRDKITDWLPFTLQRDKPAKSISGIEVLSIAEWTAHSEYSKYPWSAV
jgi:hypothetical protein